MIKLVEPDKAIHLFENNADGLRYLKRDALGNTIDYTYGIFDQVTDVKDKNNVHTVSAYYALTDIPAGALQGKLHRVVMPQATVNGIIRTNVVVAEYQYNADGTLKRIEETIDPATPLRKRIIDLTYSYSVNGFTLTKTTSGSTAGGSVTTVSDYDSLWRLSSETVSRRTSATDAAMTSLTTSYEYDGLNRPVKVTDALGNIAETIYWVGG